MCPGCHLFRFCCQEHIDRYTMYHGHGLKECNRCRERAINAEDSGFFSFPFDWYPDNQTRFASRCAFFETIGIHLKDPFSTDCDCISLPKVSRQVPILKSAFAEQSCLQLSSDELKKRLLPWWGDEGNTLIMECDCLKDIDEVYNWESYFGYKRRALGSERVDAGAGTKLAMILDIPLTIFWCIKRFLLNCNFSDNENPKTLRLIIAGPEKEHNQWPMLLELFNLLPGFEFEINMIGPELPSSMDGKTVEIVGHTQKKMKLFFKSAVLVDQDSFYMEESHIVCALNAGLAAYPQWIKTISHVKAFMGMQKSLKIFFFSDYVEESIEIARKNLFTLFGGQCLPEYKKSSLQFLCHQDLHHIPGWDRLARYLEEHVKISQLLINPFRKPLTCVDQLVHLMPYAPNGFGCFIEVR